MWFAPDFINLSCRPTEQVTKWNDPPSGMIHPYKPFFEPTMTFHDRGSDIIPLIGPQFHEPLNWCWFTMFTTGILINRLGAKDGRPQVILQVAGSSVTGKPLAVCGCPNLKKPPFQLGYAPSLKTIYLLKTLKIVEQRSAITPVAISIWIKHKDSL